MYKKDLGYDYPKRTDQHMIKVKHLANTNFDENYHYFDDSKWFHFKRFMMNVFLYAFGYLMVTIRHGLRIVGRENIKKNKKLFKDGAITICNHVFMWDYLCVLKGIKPKLQYHLAWPINFEGPNRKLIKLVGGVPIPDTRRALFSFDRAVNEILKKNYWLHAFPEGSLWFYYPKIRPIKKGIFVYAYKNNKPVIPMALSFREPKGIYKLFTKNPQVTLKIGEPELINFDLPKTEAIKDIQKRCYIKMQELAGITKDDPDYCDKVFEENEEHEEENSSSLEKC